jgi:hypothetical protein
MEKYLIECGMRIADCGLKPEKKDLSECGMRIADCGLKTEKRNLSDCRMRIGDLLAADSEPSNFGFWIADLIPNSEI